MAAGALEYTSWEDNGRQVSCMTFSDLISEVIHSITPTTFCSWRQPQDPVQIQKGRTQTLPLLWGVSKNYMHVSKPSLGVRMNQPVLTNIISVLYVYKIKSTNWQSLTAQFTVCRGAQHLSLVVPGPKQSLHTYTGEGNLGARWLIPGSSSVILSHVNFAHVI